MYKIKLEGMLDDGTPVSYMTLKFDYYDDFDSLSAKVMRFVAEIEREEEADEQVHDGA